VSKGKIKLEKINDNPSRKNLLTRLKRIEGQIKGLQRMLNEDKCCSDILVQVAAVRAAINKVGILIFEEHSRNCLKNAFLEENDEALDSLIDVLNKFVR
jgi:DNA-binding FrmR family transcriptional regulator